MMEEYRLNFHADEWVEESTLYTLSDDLEHAIGIFESMTGKDTREGLVWDHMERYNRFNDTWENMVYNRGKPDDNQ